MNFINTFGLHETQGHACGRSPSTRTDAPAHSLHRSSRSMPSSYVLPTDSVGGLVVINRIVLTLPPVAAGECVRVTCMRRYVPYQSESSVCPVDTSARLIPRQKTVYICNPVTADRVAAAPLAVG